MALVYYKGKLIDDKLLPPGATADVGTSNLDVTNTGQYQDQMDGYSRIANLGNAQNYNADSGYSNSALDIAKTKRFNAMNQGMDYLNKGYETAAYGDGGRNAYETARNAPGPTPDPSFKDKYLNADFLGGAGSVLEGFGSLAKGWAAMKNLKLTKEAMDTQQNQWNTNYEAQRTATNNQIGNQNAWKQAQGRTDYGSYVGGKPSGTTYVG
tara:strand:- start:86 stop:715 length:630 start_codon:yes stop_codon:yes gene_type:complete